jgi:hypothetical protein
MYNLKTDGVHTTRDVIWLRRMYYTAPTAVPELALELDDDIDIITPQDNKADKNQNKLARESVDYVDLDEDEDDDAPMPRLIPQVDDANDSDSSDQEDDDENSESEKGKSLAGRHQA